MKINRFTGKELLSDEQMQEKMREAFKHFTLDELKQITKDLKGIDNKTKV